MFLRMARRLTIPNSWQLIALSAVYQWPLLLLLLLAARQGLAQDSLAEEHPNELRGTVINAVTQAPIPRALVSSADNRFAMLTDSEGQFAFTLPKEQAEADGDGALLGGTVYVRTRNNVWLSARKPGFFEAPADSRATRSSEGDLILRLVPESLIIGRIHLSGDEGLPRATVQLFPREVIDGVPHWVPGPVERTNSAGEFRFAELRAGQYKLLSHELRDDDPLASVQGQTHGYPPVYYPGAADFASAATINLAAGQTVETDLSPVRQRYYNVKIPIANQDIGGINVSVVGQQGPGFSLGYNAAAKRIEGLLPNGTYTIQANAFGPASSSGTVSLSVEGADVEGRAMTLIPSSSVRLEVKEEFTDTSSIGSASWGDGKRTFTVRGPRRYLQPRVESADDFEPVRGGSLRSPTGPNDDSLVLENLPPGKYWLRLDTAHGYVASARMGSLDLLHQPFTLVSGSSPTIEIEMRDDGAQIEATVTNPDETGSEGREALGPDRWVYCVPVADSPGRFQEGPVSEDGKFEHSMLAPGGYRILAFARRQPRLPYRDPEAMRAYETRGVVIHVAAGEKLSVQVPLIPDSD